MIITVLQRHIDNGQKSKPESCPLALAAKEQYGSANVGVESGTIGGKEYKFPPPVSWWISAFDQGDTVSPIDIELPDV